jgi:hypothetical protein
LLHGVGQSAGSISGGTPSIVEVVPNGPRQIPTIPVQGAHPLKSSPVPGHVWEVDGGVDAGVGGDDELDGGVDAGVGRGGDDELHTDVTLEGQETAVTGDTPARDESGRSIHCGLGNALYQSPGHQ